MTLTKRKLLAGLATLPLALSAKGLAAQGVTTVVATTGMIADAARQVGGDLVEVRGLMGPGVDPHSYRQTRSDIVAMARADVVLWHGLYLEAQMEEFLQDLGERGTTTAVAEGLPRDLLLAHDDYDDKFDPHVWMVPDLWTHVVENVRDALSAVRPDSAEVFAANAAAHLAELDELATYAAGILASVPEESRVLVTAHDAFNYFGQAYGFEVMGIQGISTESEAGLRRIADLVDILVDRRIGAVFVESSVSDRNIRALIEGAAAKGHEVVIGGELFSDAMGEPGTYVGTYVGMIDHNATTIAGALGGDVPRDGMKGLLNG
ncbi:manganese transporter [Mameliella alba]|uniref:Periplasmic metal ion-binding lipoprotein n=1 Tax=Mameliella alba TaxID=561184 RepID=A0A0B3RJT0_9RHOB|nr:Periplasmic metal ion-binding lipoprotein [Mameliella alba]PTR36228.1 manganese/zinc/iron transport system substrate-binding protein [Mameliella alba]BBU54723.1 manganese transporter [Mameliella alba]GGF80182.1 manganese transporter [Mameliella alba]SDE01055.1 manganese/zinc/iron transport system substrate-binding protein [Mameliella alba]